MLTKAIILKEDYTEAYQLRAEVLWGMKQAKDAAEDIQKLLSLNPEDEQALLLKGEILAATGEGEQAEECSNKERGRNKLLKGDKDGSVEDMKKAMELAPETEENISGQYNNYENMTKNVPF